MRRFLLIPLLFLAMPAFASDDICHVAKSDWRPVEELKSELEAKGWTVSNVKEDDGCYEVYGKDADGQRVEIFFDPATFEQMGSDD